MREPMTEHLREHLLALTKLGNELLAAEKRIGVIEDDVRSLLGWPKKDDSKS